MHRENQKPIGEESIHIFSLTRINLVPPMSWYYSYWEMHIDDDCKKGVKTLAYEVHILKMRSISTLPDLLGLSIKI